MVPLDPVKQRLEMLPRFFPRTLALGDRGQDPPGEEEAPIGPERRSRGRFRFSKLPELQENLGTLCLQAPQGRVRR